MKIGSNPIQSKIVETATNAIDTVQQATKKVIANTTAKVTRPVVKPEPQHFDLYIDDVMEGMVPIRSASGKTRFVPESFFDIM